MSELKDYQSPEKSTWCAGCGDFGILAGLKQALAALNIPPHEILTVSGIGCGSKLPHYIWANGYNSIHGRALPVATGFRLANHALTVVVVTGDGDGYGIGGNHFLHTMRRNPDLTHIVENNQVYGLTKGQYSPTSDPGYLSTTSPDGAIEVALNPLAVALTAGATFISRAFSGDTKHLVEVLKQAITHKGYALVDVLQPCVTFNKVNTYEWYRQRVYRLEDEAGYDRTNRVAAFQKTLEWGDRIPIGVLYQEQRPTYEEQVPVLKAGGPLVRQPLNQAVIERAEALRAAFV